MPAKKQTKTKKLQPAKLIKTNGKFSWKKVLIIVVLLAAIGTILIRLTYAASPTTCYYNTCNTSHQTGRLDSRVWPAAWFASGGADNGLYAWITPFLNYQSGYTTSPSGIAYHVCVELEANSAHPDSDGAFAFTASTRDSKGKYYFSNIDGRYTVDGLKWLIKGKLNGSYMEAESASGIRGVLCGDIKAPAGTYSIPSASLTVLSPNQSTTLLINYVQMQRL